MLQVKVKHEVVTSDAAGHDEASASASQGGQTSSAGKHAQGTAHRQGRHSFVQIGVGTLATAFDSVRRLGFHIWEESYWRNIRIVHIISGISLAMFIKVLCIVSNIALQVSPIAQVKSWSLHGTGETDAAPYVSIAFCCVQWCLYGIFAWWSSSQTGFLVLVQSNCLGAVLGSYYVRSFYWHCKDPAFLNSLQKYLSVVCACFLFEVCSMCMLPPDRALFVIGVLSSIASFLGGISVLVTVPAAIRNKSSESINLTFVHANMISSILWTTCGYLLGDRLVMIPNLFTCFSCSVCMVLKAIYPSDSYLKEGVEIPGTEDAKTIARRCKESFLDAMQEPATPGEKAMKLRSPYRLQKLPKEL